GTGSIAYGRNEEGEEDRAGGWGYLVGDEGSAVWCGLEALRAVAHAVDGRGAPTRLTPLLFQELGVGEFGDVLPHLYGKPHPAPEGRQKRATPARRRSRRSGRATSSSS